MLSKAKKTNIKIYSDWTSLGKKVNASGQELEFYEDPDDGDVIVRFGDWWGRTGFGDMDVFFEGSDYMPVFIEGRNVFACQFEIDSGKEGWEGL